MKIAFLTAGGIAPCLSASIGGLIEKLQFFSSKSRACGIFKWLQRIVNGGKKFLSQIQLKAKLVSWIHSAEVQLETVE